MPGNSSPVTGKGSKGRLGSAPLGMRGGADRRRQLGHAGEEAAAAYLRDQGYAILARNFRCRFGEVDIVARQGATLAFIEVRTRRSTAYGLPEESIGERKRARLRRLAAYYLQRNGLCEVACRFDVVAVTTDREGRVQGLKHLTDAFA